MKNVEQRLMINNALTANKVHAIERGDTMVEAEDEKLQRDALARVAALAQTFVQEELPHLPPSPMPQSTRACTSTAATVAGLGAGSQREPWAPLQPSSKPQQSPPQQRSKPVAAGPTSSAPLAALPALPAAWLERAQEELLARQASMRKRAAAQQ